MPFGITYPIPESALVVTRGVLGSINGDASKILVSERKNKPMPKVVQITKALLSEISFVKI